MSNENNIKVGKNTANLLLALRAIESARNYYWLAVEELRKDFADESEPMTQEEHATFDRVRDLVQKEINDNVLTWANVTDPNSEL